MPLPLLLIPLAIKAAAVIGAKVAVAGLAVSAVGYVACKVVDAFANNIATRRGYTRFFVKLWKSSWNLVKLCAKTLGGTTIDTSTAAYTDFPSSIQNQLDNGTVTYEYSN